MLGDTDYINQHLDAIRFHCPADFDLVLAELRLIKASFASEYYAITVGAELHSTIQTSLIDLQETHNLYKDAIDPIQRANYSEFMTILHQRIDAYITKIANYTEPQKIQKLSIRGAEIIPEVPAATTLNAATTLANELRRLDILPTTKQPEAKLCKCAALIVAQAADLIEKISGNGIDFDEIYPDFDSLKLQFLVFVSHDLNIHEYDEDFFIMEKSSLEDLKAICENIKGLFNGSIFTLEDFKRLDSSARNFLIRYSTSPMAIHGTVAQDEFEFCLYLYMYVFYIEEYSKDDANQNKLSAIKVHAIAKLNNVLSLGLDSQDTKIEEVTNILASMLHVFMNNEFTIERFKKFGPSLQWLIIEKPTTMVKLFCKYHLPFHEFTDNFLLNLEQLEQLASLIDDVDTLLDGSSINFKHLLQLSRKSMLHLIKHAYRINKWCQAAKINLGDIFALSADKVVFFMREINNLYYLHIVANYYFIPVPEVLKLDLDAITKLFINMSDYTSSAVVMFNVHNQAYSLKDLQQCFKECIQSSAQHIEQLNTFGSLRHLQKLNKTPREIVTKLQNLGMNFFQCRAIYEAIIAINKKFILLYVNSFIMPQIQPKLELSFDRFEIETLFASDESAAIFRSLQQYCVYLVMFLNITRTKIGQHSKAIAMAIAPELTLMATSMGTTSDIHFDELPLANYEKLAKIFLKFMEKTNESSNITDKHLFLYNFLLSSNAFATLPGAQNWPEFLNQNLSEEDIITHLDWKDFDTNASLEADFIDFYNLMKYLKSRILEFRNLPADYLPNLNPDSDPAIFTAITQHDYNTLTSHQELRANPLFANSKCISYHSYAKSIGDSRTVSVIEDMIKTNTDVEIGKFLNKHDFDHKDALNENGDTPLTLAIKLRDPKVTIGLIVDGVDVLQPDTSGNTPLQLAQSLGMAIVVHELLSEIRSLHSLQPKAEAANQYLRMSMKV